MKKILVLSILLHGCCLLGQASAQFANAVVDYTPGALFDSYNTPTSALGQPAPIVGPDSGFPGVFSPFDPHYETTDLVGIGAGGQLTLQLQNFVNVQSGAFEIGVWSNVGLTDVDYPNGTAGNPVTTFSPPSSAVVSVSADGTHWVTLNGGSPITFSLPGNYYTNAGPFDPTAPADPQFANFGQPFTGSLSDFDGEDYAQVLATLDGSAGGTWLDLDGTGLSQVGYVRFNGVADGDELYINGVGINSSLAGAEVVPEPASAGLLLLGAVSALAWRRNRKGVLNVRESVPPVWPL
ncbi:MAG TPA: PEP-CTERM sorting domain-containing protein [Chthoniobacter sp.]|jgi:hypothetical protein